MSTMDTFSGKRFDPLKISREDISLTDIAHALSLLCESQRLDGQNAAGLSAS